MTPAGVSALTTNFPTYTVGPTTRFSLDGNFAVELDAPYQPVDYFSLRNLASSTAPTHTTGNSWEFPLVLEYALFPVPCVAQASACERFYELPQISLRHTRPLGQPIRLRPLIGQIIRSENPVQHRQMHREILVHRFPLRAVMPMMKRGRRQYRTQPPELPPDVCVNERRLNHHPRHIREHRALGESQNVDRDITDRARHHRIHQMQPRSGEPIHHLHRMMNRVKAPQKRDHVKRAMHPILRQIRKHKDQEKLRDERQRRDVRRHPSIARFTWSR